MLAKKWTVHRLHKWMGLIAAIWLLVLGLTGFLLDHRDSWRWLWQSGVSETYINDIVVDKSKTGNIKYYQINIHEPSQHVAGGLTGLWWSNNAGKDWLTTKFVGVEQAPMISMLLFAAQEELWIATDNGLWLSFDGGKSATKIALAGIWVSAISVNQKTKVLTGVIARTKIFKYLIEENKIIFIEIKTVDNKSLPTSISLSRYTRDVHYGRGIFNIPFSLLWNDISAVAMIVLPLSGFLFYWLPKRWRKNKKRKKITTPKIKKQTMRWLFRLHAPTFGLISAIPFIYLSLTGILLDHAKELRAWMKSVQVTQNWQTPVYNLKSWNGEIFGLIDDIDNSKKFSLATRLGLFTTEDDGQHWKREKVLGNKSNFVWTLRRHDKNIFIGGMGSPNLVKLDGQPWQLVKGVGHMPSDISIYSESSMIWKSRHGLKKGNLKKGFKTVSSSLPVNNYIPWFYIIDGLHSGVLIHSQWKWINDLIAVLAILLVITGLVRWWHKKWI